ncbi:SIR2 family protein [Nannocystaceae bacterium ST9]
MPASIDLDELRALAEPLIVYVGAELTRAAGLPGPRELAARLLAELPDDLHARRRRELIELAERGELADAFTELERELTRARFGRVIERALPDDQLEPPLLARVLASLGPRIRGIVTPNLDRLLERAFAGRLVTHLRPQLGLIQARDWLLKLNGTLPDRSSWVFTRDQQARVSWRDPIYANVLRSLYVGRSMLFVGATIDDPIFDAIVDEARGLAEGAPPRHWALARRGELSSTQRAKLDEAGIAAIVCDDDEAILATLASLAPDPSLVPALARKPAASQAIGGVIRVLFVSASPGELERLAVDRELRVIREALTRASQRDRIELEVRSASSFADLSRALLEREYDIVHFAGHGESTGIILDDDGPLEVASASLASLFDEHAYPRRRLRCLVFNACWSEGPSQVITAVPVVVAMQGEIADHAALAFAEGFYDAIGAGHDFALAYREGLRRAEHRGEPFEARLFMSARAT